MRRPAEWLQAAETLLRTRYGIEPGDVGLALADVPGWIAADVSPSDFVHDVGEAYGLVRCDRVGVEWGASW